jgi:hypothetical protein
VPIGEVYRAPEVTLSQRDAEHVEVSIAGSEGLRGLQATFVYEPAALRIVGVAGGEDTARIDRVFSGDPERADGRLVVGITDTRRVRLPARGALFDMTVAFVADGPTTVRLEQILAVRHSGETVNPKSTSLEVRPR